MDAETGFALGGNKVRKLEYELAPHRLAGVTHVVTSGGPQSNHARVTAAAAARLGLGCVLVLNGGPLGEPRGNALLHRLFGAEIHTVASPDEREHAVQEAAHGIRRAGGHALVVPLGASSPLGTLGYVRAALELRRQLVELWPSPEGRTLVFTAASSCGTLAGLAAGFSVAGLEGLSLMGVSADAPRPTILAETQRLARGALELLGTERPGLPAGLLDVTDREVGDGYGAPTRASRDATILFARSEGVVLDPVYTAKAAAGALQWCRSEGTPVDRVVLLHTGGHPAIFP